jgi:drug/metabolite transporter (DMT)-like permease
MAASAFGFSCMSLLVKLASPRLPTGEIVFSRALVTLVLSYVMVRRAGLSPWGHRAAPLVFRGLMGFGGITSLYIALARLPLADTTTLQNVTPLLTAVLAWWLLGERIGWPTAAAIACGLLGVTLMVHPSGNGLDPIGVVAALCGVTCSSVTYVTVRKLVRTEHPLVIVFYFPLVAAPLSLPWVISTFVMPQPIDWLLLIALGCATQIGQVFMTRALSIERAGRVTAIGYLQVALAMVWQLVIFDELPGLWTIAGTSLIIGSTLVIAQVTQPSRSEL